MLPKMSTHRIILKKNQQYMSKYMFVCESHSKIIHVGPK